MRDTDEPTGGGEGGHARVEVSFRVPAPLEQVFAYFADPANLDPSTPAWFRLDIRTPLPVELAPGALLDYRIRWRWLVSFRWQSRFTVWEPPELFTYVQNRGPFRSFRHEHRFVAIPGERGGEGGGGEATLVTDRIDFRAPGGRLLEGRVKRDLEAIFQHRIRVVGELFGER